MNRCSIFTACFALLALVTPNVAKADISLASDLVAGTESSAASPVGRTSQGVLFVAKTMSGGADLFIARAVWIHREHYNSYHQLANHDIVDRGSVLLDSGWTSWCRYYLVL
jgi:hypothetical protein